jgi:hypothetical protein
VHASTVAVLGTIVATAGIIMTGLVFVLRALWNIRGSWDDTNAKLQLLVERVAAMVVLKDADHARLDKRSEEIAGRLERHLEWHDKH